MRPKVFLAKQVPCEVEAYIAQHCDYRMWDREEEIPRQQLLEELSDADGLLISGGSIDHELLEHAPKLKIVSNVSVGYNNFDTEAMKARDVMGTHTPGVLDETVADTVFGLILATARRIPELDAYVKAGKWKKGSEERIFGIDVHHAKLGIIGMGRIGEAIARRAKFGFHMDVVYYNRSRKMEAEHKLGVVYNSLQELLQESDFVVVMTPLTPETTQIIGSEELALMKKTAIFINASRGQTVDEQALIEVLETESIRGAGLDVFQQEPVDPDNQLLQMPNVVTLPHIGSATHQTRFDMAMLAAKNLVKGLQGEIPPNLVNELKR
ncbi:bifunctional glyoxylate/hydroxypyruvate reductase B [Paenibacillus pectinilyticus]|uniref:Bifunctional glyoxylate/hydroxypyruvate reductase B n=1 Tax=Paenibacillus pectinilyticus TaxID=512399 RepID=A0A1C0ZZH0_9BACL|nr:D-glycerate dehydrogenase [Paenibacillus pectinilyticus]OCT13518.1 bifunctional glyoxylate/hydroxypyruvate reductase B [Paenibacillus pectinilyticus]